MTKEDLVKLGVSEDIADNVLCTAHSGADRGTAEDY